MTGKGPQQSNSLSKSGQGTSTSKQSTDGEQSAVSTAKAPPGSSVGQRNVELMEEFHRRLKRNLGSSEPVTSALIKRKFLQQTLGNPQCWARVQKKKKGNKDGSAAAGEDEDNGTLEVGDVWAMDALDALKSDLGRKNNTQRKLAHGGGWWSATGKWKVVESVKSTRLKEKQQREAEKAEEARRKEEQWQKQEEEKLRAKFNEDVKEKGINVGGIAFSNAGPGAGQNFDAGENSDSDLDSDDENNSKANKKGGSAGAGGQAALQIINSMAELLTMELGSLTGYGLYGDGKKHPASVSIQDLDLVVDWTRVEPFLLNAPELRPFLSRWKYLSLASRQLRTVAEYEERWMKLEALHPLNDLNWLADQFVFLHLSREYRELGFALDTNPDYKPKVAAVNGNGNGNRSGKNGEDEGPGGTAENPAAEQTGENANDAGAANADIKGGSKVRFARAADGQTAPEKLDLTDDRFFERASNDSSYRTLLEKEHLALTDPDAFKPGQFGWISLLELQAVCGAFIELRFPDRNLYIEDSMMTQAMFLKGLEIAFSMTAPVSTVSVPFEVSFDTACVVCEICRILWLRFQKQGGWGKREVSRLEEIFPVDSGDVSNARVFTLLQKGGIPVDAGEEQTGFIDLLRESDINQDGVTSFEEFCYLLKRFDDTLRRQEVARIVEHGYVDLLPGTFLDEWGYILKSRLRGGKGSSTAATSTSKNASSSYQYHSIADLRDALTTLGLEQISRERLRQMDKLREELEIDARQMDDYDICFLLGACFQRNTGDFAQLLREWAYEREKKRMGKHAREKKDLLKPTIKLSVMDHLDDVLSQDFKSDWWFNVAKKTLQLSIWEHERPHFLTQKISGGKHGGGSAALKAAKERKSAGTEGSTVTMGILSETPGFARAETNENLAEARRLRTLQRREKVGINSDGGRVVIDDGGGDSKKKKEVWRI